MLRRIRSAITGRFQRAEGADPATTVVGTYAPAVDAIAYRVPVDEALDPTLYLKLRAVEGLTRLDFESDTATLYFRRPTGASTWHDVELAAELESLGFHLLVG